MGGECEKCGVGERCLQCFGGKPEEKRPLGRLKCRWEDNIMMYLQEVEGEIMDWMELDQDRDRRRALVNVVIVLRFP